MICISPNNDRYPITETFTPLHFAWSSTYILDHISLSCSYSEKCFRKVVQKIKKIYIAYSIKFPFRKFRLLWDKVEKYCRETKGTCDKLAHAHCMLSTSDYKCTITIWIIYWFYTAKIGCTTATVCYILVPVSTCNVVIFSNYNVCDI
jgi:hypothetical protein